MIRSPYDLDEHEQADVAREASEFAKTINPWTIQNGHGAYREKRPGLGIQIVKFNYRHSTTPPTESITYRTIAWRTIGEERFGDSLKQL
jgi:hypothetical protein